MIVTRATPSVLLVCLVLCGCSQRQTPSAPSKDSATKGEISAFSDGTIMRVLERTGESLRGVHIVRKASDGGSQTIDAESGRIDQSTNTRVTRIILFNAHVDFGPRGRAIIEQMTVELTKELDRDSLKRIARDLRNQRLTNQTQRTGR